MPTKYKIGDKTYNIPDEKVKAFLKDFPDAQEINVQKDPTFLEAIKEQLTPRLTQSTPLGLMQDHAMVTEVVLNLWDLLTRKMPVAAIPEDDESFTSKLFRGKELSETIGMAEDQPTFLGKIGKFAVNMLGLDLIPVTKGVSAGRAAVRGAADDLASGFAKGFKEFAEEGLKPKGKLPLDNLLERAKGELNRDLTGRSKLLENKVIKGGVVNNQEKLGEIRGAAMNMESTIKAAEMMPPSAAKEVIEDLAKDKVLTPLQRIVLAFEGKRSAPQIVADAVDNKLNDMVSQILKSKKQSGQALRTERDVNRIIIDGINDEIIKLAPKDQKKARKFFEAFDIGDKGSFNPTAMQKFVEWATMIKLTGISTHEKNVLGNVVEIILRYPEKFAAGTTDALIYGGRKLLGKKAKRQVFIREALAEGLGTAKAIKNATHKAYSVFVNPTKYLEEATKAGEVLMRGGRGAIGRGGKVFEPFDKLLKKASGDRFGFNLGEIVRSPGRLLGAMDVFFKELNHGAEIYALATRKALQDGKRGAELVKATQKYIENPTPKMLERAKESALERVFQKKLGSISQRVDSFRKAHPLSRLVIPFWKTPVNLMKRSLERSVIPAFYRPMWKKLPIAQRRELIGRMAVGSTIMSGLTMYALEGNISADGEDKVNTDLLRMGGWQPYSVKVGDTWVSYRGFEPLSSWFRMTGNLAEAKISDDNYAEWAAEFGKSYIREFSENPFMMGTKNLIELLDSKQESRASRFIANMAVGSTIPVIFQQWNRVWDPTVRKPIKTKDQPFPVNYFGQIAREFQARTPVVSKDITPLRNIFGEPIVRESPVSQAFGLTTSVEKDSGLGKELARLAKQGFTIGKPSRSIAGKSLTDEEYDRFLTLSGAMFKETISKFINWEGYNDLPDDIKMKEISNIKREINQIIREKDFYKYYTEGD